MPSITLTVDEAIIKKVRKIAVDKSTTLTEMVREFLKSVAESELALVHQSIDTHSQYRISYWGAMIIAAAAREGCSYILSEDLSHGQRYSGMTVQNPFHRE
jgi:predicted nucleic acid-binding protein